MLFDCVTYGIAGEGDDSDDEGKNAISRKVKVLFTSCLVVCCLVRK